MIDPKKYRPALLLAVRALAKVGDEKSMNDIADLIEEMDQASYPTEKTK